MSKVAIETATLDAIGQAIITKGGAVAPMKPSEMPAAIAAIPSGGIEEYPKPWANDEWTHLWFYMTYFRDVKIVASFIAANGFSVDWGDGQIEDIASSSTATTRTLTHTYDSEGAYEVKIYDYDEVIFNNDGFVGGGYTVSHPQTYTSIMQIQFGEKANPTLTFQAPACNLKAIKLPPNCNLAGAGNFYKCVNLSVCNFENLKESTGASPFRMTGFTAIPDIPTLTECSNYLFFGCNNLVSIGNLINLTTGGTSMLAGNENLITVGDLSALTVLPQSCFQGDTNLTTVGDMSALTEVKTSAFLTTGKVASLTFRTKTHTEVAAITGFTNFPNRGQACVFHCSDGDFYRSGSNLIKVES